MEERVSRTIELILSLLPPITDQAARQRVCANLQKRLLARCKQSWHEKEPLRGSAARCITLFARNMDKDLVEVFEAEGMLGNLETILPSLGEVAIWMDPDGVWCRVNDRGMPQAYAPGKPPPVTPRGTSAIPIIAPVKPKASSNK